MSRQHATPLLIDDLGNATALSQLSLGAGPDQISEAQLQAFIHAHPEALPIAEIDPLFAAPVAICIELNTSAGPIDNLLMTPTGLPVLVECKLWRNPQGRREVVGQILDYAKELSRWSSADMQREVSRRCEGRILIDMIRAAGHKVDEIAFNDALTLNLRRGRFLLLIVGDGIREGVEAIAEYLQAHAGLHFTLGLVEMPIFTVPGGNRLVAPRVVARTLLITREVVAIPAGYTLNDPQQRDVDPEDASDDGTDKRVAFMRELVAEPFGLDPEQPRARPSEKGWMYLYMPAPASSCWVGVLFKESGRRVGVRLSSNARTVGEAAIARVVQDWANVEVRLGGNPILREQSSGRYVVEELRTTANIADPEQRRETQEWLRGRLRDFVAVFRPAIRDAVEAMRD